MRTSPIPTLDLTNIFNIVSPMSTASNGRYLNSPVLMKSNPRGLHSVLDEFMESHRKGQDTYRDMKKPELQKELRILNKIKRLTFLLADNALNEKLELLLEIHSLLCQLPSIENFPAINNRSIVASSTESSCTPRSLVKEGNATVRAVDIPTVLKSILSAQDAQEKQDLTAMTPSRRAYG